MRPKLSEVSCSVMACCLMQRVVAKKRLGKSSQKPNSSYDGGYKTGFIPNIILFSKSLPPNMFTAVGAWTHTKAVDYAASLKTHPSWMSCTILGLSCVQSTRLCSLLR